jgi:head-tail adaptor
MIAIGELKYYITIQSPSTSRNSYGEVNLSSGWTDVFSRWSKMEFKKGKESEIGLERTSSDFYEFNFRAEFDSTNIFGKLIPNDYRVQLSNGAVGTYRIFEIEGGGYWGKNKEWYKLTCVEKDS